MDVGGALHVAGMIVSAGIMAWFWPHCAKPCLVAFRVRPAAYWLAFGLSVITIVVLAADATAELIGFRGGLFSLRWWSVGIAGITWLLIVGATQWPRFSLLIRLFRSSGQKPSPSADQ